MLDPTIERWRKYLRRDPTRWLLDSAPPFAPSIQLAYQRDLAYRPEDAPAVRETRERVLYSPPIQTLFNTQDPLGFWGDPQSLTQPNYRTTLWNLALLAELGTPRTSRRARAACEFALQMFQDERGRFAGLSAVEAGYLVRALSDFDLASDERVRHAARGLIAWSAQEDSVEAQTSALWAWRAFTNDGMIAEAISSTLERVLDSLSQLPLAPITFPQFDPRDPLFILRVLAEYHRVSDPRDAELVEQFIARQDYQGRWTLERSLDELLMIPFETQGAPSRWITLNALRVIVKLVEGSPNHGLANFR